MLESISPPNAASRTPRFAVQLRSHAIETLQVHLIATCNLACRHCHVESSPARTERMSREDMLVVLEVATRLDVVELDLTGGAPELHPQLVPFVRDAVGSGRRVRVRTNLTVLSRSDLQHLPVFFRDHGVRLSASLPCYLVQNVDRQRGTGVFDESIAVLRRLNSLGYAREEGLELDLVYNPSGPSLPPDQERLEHDYRVRLREQHGVEFNRLFALANMPIGRFAQDLERKGELDGYFELLAQAFNPRTIDGLMCRRQLHVGWDGRLYDCDFNYALGLPLLQPGPAHVRDLLRREPSVRSIATGEHCLGCTAGQGSSCSGALT